ncbi:hypothetical protein VTN31DRAFT_4389 [Thermomyces dupontii]|uniref:uncharacterized protein n=1 Tax=Talaromyces thermophilus TaxID=28565 RepID=UPI00374312BE
MSTADSPVPTRAGPFRRLSQLRAYTQSRRSSFSFSSSPPTANSRPYRNSFSRVVPFRTSLHSTSSSDRSPSPPDPQVFSSQPRPASTSSNSDSSSGSNSSVSSNASNNSSRADLPAQPPLQESPAPTNPPSEPASAMNGAASQSQNNTMASSTANSNSGTSSTPAGPQKPKPRLTIRFFAYQDPHHNARPSLPFPPMSRTLPSEDSVIRVGRYSERDGVPELNPTEPSDAPIGFKSKVVSRRHCEFSVVNGQWHIKDVGSSSGTFLNRMRLSQPNMVSRLYAVRDGDIVQLGIDFRGGEEMIFRCVRIRIECNRGWQQQPNEFNKNTETLIKNLGKGKDAEDFAGCRECSICLGSVLRPYQCLFMAACAHVWHYKCIHRLIHGPDYPMFQCPNCRAWTDLSAEVDDDDDDYDRKKIEAPPTSQETSTTQRAQQSNRQSSEPQNSSSEDNQLASRTAQMRLENQGRSQQGNDNSGEQNTNGNGSGESRHSENIPIPERNQSGRSPGIGRPSAAAAASETFEDNPMTPRNDSGPLAFDGRAGRR